MKSDEHNEDGDYGILVMATDGLWDVSDNEVVSRTVFQTLHKYSEERHRYTMAAQELVARARGKINDYGHWRLADCKAAATVDDISVIVVPVHQYYKEHMEWEQRCAREYKERMVLQATEAKEIEDGLLKTSLTNGAGSSSNSSSGIGVVSSIAIDNALSSTWDKTEAGRKSMHSKVPVAQEAVATINTGKGKPGGARKQQEHTKAEKNVEANEPDLIPKSMALAMQEDNSADITSGIVKSLYQVFPRPYFLTDFASISQRTPRRRRNPCAREQN